MIARLEGLLVGIENHAALVKVPGGVTYAVLVTAYTAARLGGRLDQPIELITFPFLESQGQGNILLPRLAGFTTPTDREFFELFVTTKGIGYRRGLRAMAMATDQIAAAIADRDLGLLQSLPEVGRRTAETIVATLRGKVDRFISTTAATPASAGKKGAKGAAEGTPSAPPSIAREALEVLVQLGETRTQALTWIDAALAADDRPADTQALVAAVYRIKAGG